MDHPYPGSPPLPRIRRRYQTYLKVHGRWCYLYGAIDRNGNLVDVLFSEHRDMAAAQAFFRSAKAVTGVTPDRVTTDGRDSYPRAIRTELGSVRARASKYSLCSRTCGDVQSCGFQDGQHRHGAAEELEPAAIGGNVLVVAGARAGKVAEFIVGLAEPSGGSGAIEAPQ